MDDRFKTMSSNPSIETSGLNEPARWGLMAVLLLVVAVIVAAAHWPVLSAQAISIDDTCFMFENPALQPPGLGAVKRIFAEIWGTSASKGYYEPLTLVTLMLDMARGGCPENLRPFHHTNLALHVANTVLIVVFLYLLFRDPWTASLLGLLFGLHPLTVESVAWVWERKTLLAAFFALWAFVLYVLYVQKAGGGHPSTPSFLYLACLLCYLLAVLAKPTATPLVALLLLLDYWPLRRLGRRSILEKIPFFVVALASAAITVISTHLSAKVALPSLSPTAFVLKVCYLNIFYLGKMLWPTRLTSVYVLPQPMAFSQTIVIVTFVLFVALLIGIFASLRRTRAALVGCLFFFVAISPTFGLVDYSWVSASDKYVYLPVVGLLVMLGAGLSRLRAAMVSRGRAWLAGVALCVTVMPIAGMYVYLTQAQIARWRDTEVWVRYMLRMAPDSMEMHDELGRILARKGEYSQAVALCRRAIELGLDIADTRNNLGMALTGIGRIDEAIEQYGLALERNPDHAEAHNNLGAALLNQGKQPEAVAMFRRAIEKKPRYADAHLNLGTVLLDQGKVDEAIRELGLAVEYKPSDAIARFQYGRALAVKGKLDESLKQLYESIRIKPDEARVRVCLGLVLVQARRPAEAELQFSEAIRLNPSDADAHVNYGNVLMETGRVNEAVRQYAAALRIQPDSLVVLGNLAWTLATKADIKTPPEIDAVQLSEHACRLTGNQDANLLDTLAAAYAAAGRFPDAVATAHRAIEQATAQGLNDLVAQIRPRLSLYQAGKPYRE